MHFSSKIPTSVRHGPVQMGGLGIYHLCTEAGLEALKFFRNSLHSQTEAGNLIRLNMEYSQREAGIGQPLMQHLPYLTPSWLLFLRQYLSTHNMHVVVTDTHVDELRGPTDQYIMDPIHLQRYSTSHQRDINLVCLFLQVSTISDLVDTSSPKRIDLSLLDARRSPSFAPSIKWPRQCDEPTDRQRRLWKGISHPPISVIFLTGELHVPRVPNPSIRQSSTLLLFHL
jgi:hypothetical protein